MSKRNAVPPRSSLPRRARQVSCPAGTFGNTALDIVIARGKGGHVWDVCGNEYVDFLLGSGPMLVGHAHPEVDGGGAGAGAARHDLLRQQPAGHAACRRDRRGRAVRRAGAFRLDRLGGRSLCHARRPRLEEARQDPEVRGWLSRHERLRPHEPGAEAARAISLRPFRIPPASRARCATRCWSRPTTTWRR